MRRGLLGGLSFLALATVGLVGAAEKASEKPAAKNSAAPQLRRPSDVLFILVETSGYDEDSRKELQFMYDVLRKLDKNHNGQLDQDELTNAREQIVAERANYILKRLDADKDGKISKEEAKGRIQEHFDRLDANKDGYVDRAELIHAIAGHAKAAVEKATPSKDSAAPEHREK